LDIAGWIWSGAIGFGRETINGTSTQPTRLAEVTAQGALFDGVRLAITAIYNKSTGYVDSPDYSYRRLGVTLIYPF
jgi:hypothetical protein